MLSSLYKGVGAKTCTGVGMLEKCVDIHGGF